MLSPKSINVLHILLIGPFLAYVGLNGRKCSPLVFHILAAVGLIVIAYHVYALYIKMGRTVSIASVGTAITGSMDNVKAQIIGQDNAGNNVAVDEAGNVAVVDHNGQVVALNNDKATKSADQAMANNNANNNSNNH